MDIIRELWYGNVAPFEQSTRGDKQLKELLKLAARNKEELDRTLTEKQQEILEKFEENMNEMHGLVGSDGVLLFDFHMYPSRPMADGSQEAHFPTEDDPQRATFQAGHSDSIYGKSLGGMTYSGWECNSLPYLVELDNYGDDTPNLHKPNPQAMSTWGMDEITWYANQPDWYRAEFLEYAYEWVMNEAEGDGFFAILGQRVARIYDEDNNIIAWQYYAYDSKNHKEGFDDEAVIKEIWASYEK